MAYSSSQYLPPASPPPSPGNSPVSKGSRSSGVRRTSQPEIKAAINQTFESTPEDLDRLLRALDIAFLRVHDAKGYSVRLPSAEIDLLKVLEKVRDLMSDVLKSGSRQKLQDLFGGECTRITRIRALLDASNFSEMNAGDQRLRMCAETCTTIEKLLTELGLKEALQKARERVDTEDLVASLEQELGESEAASPCRRQDVQSRMSFGAKLAAAAEDPEPVPLPREKEALPLAAPVADTSSIAQDSRAASQVAAVPANSNELPRQDWEASFTRKDSLQQPVEVGPSELVSEKRGSFGSFNSFQGSFSGSPTADAAIDHVFCRVLQDARLQLGHQKFAELRATIHLVGESKLHVDDGLDRIKRICVANRAQAFFMPASAALYKEIEVLLRKQADQSLMTLDDFLKDA
eukprot:TRINITY_DN64115_c0_g1_i1.p1 TRINITY_DN64115_c0_g1~~TRINITY_DN64115_c0_g1_i1.p1  ORF type:complete len:405 (+),score=102.55 TRINITY_DN64115_c0_g1_i1:63-1277(+)